MVEAIALNCRLEVLPEHAGPLSSLQATGVSELQAPEYTWSTVSKSLPQVLTTTGPLLGGVHVNQTPLPKELTQVGRPSPVSVALAVLMAKPVLSVNAVAPAHWSFAGGVPGVPTWNVMVDPRELKVWK